MLDAIKIGVVIVSYNSDACLFNALKALSKQTVPPDEVIVFDNAETALSFDKATLGFEVHYIKSEANIGFAAGNNRAVSRLNSSINWIAFLNPDAYPEPTWLESMVSFIQKSPDYVLLGSQLVWDDNPHLLDGTGDAYHISGRAWRMNHQKPIKNAPKLNQDIFSPCAAAALCHRQPFELIGGFDEHFFCYYEDIDLAFRLRLMGYQCAYVADAVVKHTGSATTTRHSDFCVYHGHRNLVWTFVKNMPTLLLCLFLPLHLALNLFSIGLMITKGQGRVILKAKVDALKGLKRVWVARKACQKERTISIKDLMAALHKGLPWP